MKRKPDEPRLHYLARVAAAFIKRHAPDDTIHFDEAECDGSCLAQDITNELEDGECLPVLQCADCGAVYTEKVTTCDCHLGEQRWIEGKAYFGKAPAETKIEMWRKEARRSDFWYSGWRRKYFQTKISDREHELAWNRYRKAEQRHMKAPIV